MNSALVVAFLRQRLTSPLRVVLLGFSFFVTLIFVAATKGIAPLEGAAVWFALTLAAGAIGQEVSSGVLSLTFARPITRATYVLSRWGAAGGFAAALGLVQVAASLMVIAARGGPLPHGADIAALAIECVLEALTTAAVVVMLSSLVNGLGDVGLWFLTAMIASFTGMLTDSTKHVVLARLAHELLRTVMPSLRVGWLFGAGDSQVYALLATLSTLTASLAVAVWVVNRKELSYAAG